jgi:hypothetical protein
MSESIVTLPCGCFFQGRKMFCAEDCDEHEEEPEMHQCDNCGRMFPIDELDGKPTINSKLRRIRAREGQRIMLRRAADLGFEFDRLECRRCYGPGYEQAGG